MGDIEYFISISTEYCIENYRQQDDLYVYMWMRVSD